LKTLSPLKRHIPQQIVKNLITPTELSSALEGELNHRASPLVGRVAIFSLSPLVAYTPTN